VPSKPVLIWCQACDVGYGSMGERPTLCPACHQVPNWTRTPPYKLTPNDRQFLRSIRVASE
jgi:hypothetical protein